jgi:peptidoglycan/xylan/chitin deacetylase (PgdA/CDA1 family)
VADSTLFRRIRDGYRRKRSLSGGQHLIELRPQFPIVSFTFDDFPRSAARVGGAILGEHGMRGTYYVSLGLMNCDLPAGPGFSAEDLRDVVSEGHELGCHTFAHCHAWETRPSAFEKSVVENKRALEGLLPTASFRSLSYPIAMPRPETKLRVAKYYSCSRGGVETINVGTTDANSLSACFLEKHRGDADSLKRLMDENSRAHGWLIFATHDVAPSPSPFGCTPEFFREIVSYAASSGARVIPVAEAWGMLTTDGNVAKPASSTRS